MPLLGLFCETDWLIINYPTFDMAAYQKKGHDIFISVEKYKSGTDM